jgi:NitT/TauT family transport system substrate-binding protein
VARVEYATGGRVREQSPRYCDRTIERWRDTMWSRHVSLAVVALLITAIITPVAAQTVQPGSASPPYRFKVAGTVPGWEWYFLLIEAGQDQGIWAKHGLEPEFVPAAKVATELTERIAAGVKIGYVSTAEVTLARAAGLSIKTIAGYIGDTLARVFVAADGPIRSPRDLDGQKFGVVAADDTSYRAILYVNRRLSIKAEPVVLGSVENRIAAVKSGQIAAFYSSEGVTLTRVGPGELRVLVPLSDLYPRPYTAVVVWATEDLIAENPDLVKRFVAATLEAAQYLKDHPIYASDRYTKLTNAPKALADQVAARLAQGLSPDGRGNGGDLVAAVAGNWKFMTDSGAVPATTRVNIEDVVDARFLPSR